MNGHARTVYKLDVVTCVRFIFSTTLCRLVDDDVLVLPGAVSTPVDDTVADPEFSKGGFQDSAREARGEKLLRSRPLPVQTGGKNEEVGRTQDD